MAKYLRTSSITAELENLIREARKELYIISPYLKLSDNMKELLNDKEREKVDVRIIFGKQELAPTEMSYLEKLKYVRLYFSKNLHAKCYLNENKMIIASMNLYEFSQQHNREMGILIDTAFDEDKAVYEEASSDIESIMHNSEDFSYVQAPPKQAQSEITKEVEISKIEKGKNKKVKEQFSIKIDLNKHYGYCIRTGVEIPFNVEKPMSYSAFKSWSKFNDCDFAEKFCHFSGEFSNGKTSVNKPILKKYWKEAKKLIEH